MDEQTLNLPPSADRLWSEDLEDILSQLLWEPDPMEVAWVEMAARYDDN